MSTLQTLDRGLRALEVISHSPRGISVAELAKELDVHRAICYRIVATLEDHLLVARTEDGRVRLAVGVAVLASRFEPQLHLDARPLLQALANETHATAFVSAAEGQDCVAVQVAEPDDQLLTVGYRVGSRHPLDKGAAGIAILALRPRSRASRKRCGSRAATATASRGASWNAARSGSRRASACPLDSGPAARWSGRSASSPSRASTPIWPRAPCCAPPGSWNVCSPPDSPSGTLLTRPVVALTLIPVRPARHIVRY
ncbi:IclR family transcriptional regulator [Prauserella oleivorans]